MDTDPSTPVSPAAEKTANDFKEEGNTHFKKASYEKALQLYSSAIDLAPNDATLYSNRAAAYLMQKKYKEALEDSLKATSLDPSFMKAFIRAANCYVHLGDFDQARAVLIRSGKTSSPTLASELRKVEGYQDQLQRVKDAVANSQWLIAFKVADELLKEADDSLELRLIQIQCLIGQKKFPEAMSIANALYFSYPTNTDVIVFRGIALYYTGNTVLAQKHFQQVLKLDPDHRKAIQMFKMLKKLEAAKTEGTTAFSEGKWAEAINAFTEAVAVDPLNDTYNSQIYCNRAAARMKLKQYQEALEDCKQAIDLKEDYAKAYLRRAECNTQLGDHEEAVRDYEKANKYAPDDASISQKLRQAKLEAKKAKRKDYYKILDISKDADENDIKKAYKRQALKWHPDKNRESEEQHDAAEKMFKDIGEAYNVLSDHRLRQRYDQGADLEEEPSFNGASHMDINELFSMFNSGGARFGGFGGGGARFSFG